MDLFLAHRVVFLDRKISLCCAVVLRILNHSQWNHFKTLRAHRLCRFVQKAFFVFIDVKGFIEIERIAM